MVLPTWVQEQDEILLCVVRGHRRAVTPTLSESRQVHERVVDDHVVTDVNRVLLHLLPEGARGPASPGLSPVWIAVAVRPSGLA